MRRRLLLAAGAAGVAGCSGREDGGEITETVTTAGVLEPTPERGVPFAALFEVERSSLESSRFRDTVHDGDVVEIVYNHAAREELILRRVGGAGDAVELVPEAVGSIPVFRGAIPRLDGADEVRVRTSPGDVAFEYLAAAVRASAVDAGDAVSVLGRTFSVRTGFVVPKLRTRRPSSRNCNR